jgi:tetratricopeptide (TPR) repeat protein
MADMKIRHIVFSSLGAIAMLGASGWHAFAMNLQDATSKATAAYQLILKSDFAAAVTAYTEIIGAGILSQDALRNALLNRALAEQRLGKFALSIEDYTAALAVPGISAELRALALYNRGLGYHQSKDLIHSVEDYTAALMAKPDLSQAYFARGQVLREEGQLLFALSDFERALKYGFPKPGRVHFVTALTHEQLLRPIEARKEYAAALSVDPGMESAKQRLALLGGPVADALPVTPAEPATASVEVTERTLPKPVEPAAALMGTAPKPAEQDNITTATMEPLAKSQKLYTDRIAPSEQPVNVPSASQSVAGSNEITGSVTPAPAKSAANDVQQPQPTSSGWAVQLVSAASQPTAESGWQQLRRKFKILQDFQPQIVRADLGSKGIMYRVRLLGYQKQSEAASVCAKLHGKGVPCYISNTGS